MIQKPDDEAAHVMRVQIGQQKTHLQPPLGIAVVVVKPPRSAEQAAKGSFEVGVGCGQFRQRDAWAVAHHVKQVGQRLLRLQHAWRLRHEAARLHEAGDHLLHLFQTLPQIAEVRMRLPEILAELQGALVAGDGFQVSPECD